MNNITIATPTGNINIDAKLFQGYNQEALGILDKIATSNDEFKMLVETVAETTGMVKGVVARYFKARFKEKTKEATEQGELFEQLDGVLE